MYEIISFDDFLRIIYRELHECGNNLIITICGPIRLYDRIELAATVVDGVDLNNNINQIFMPIKLNNKTEISDEFKKQLVLLHRVKIDMSNYVVVVGNQNEWGQDTKNEIAYAISKNKNIVFIDEKNLTININLKTKDNIII